jgi:integrase
VCDGWRYDTYAPVQRYLCYDCGYRFSFPPAPIFGDIKRHQFGRKNNMSSATVLKTVAGDDPRIAQYEWKCRKRQLQQNTIDLRTYHLRNLVKEGADLNSPESIEIVLATKDYPTATKWLLVNAYHSYCKLFGIQWEKIKVKYQPKMPHIPTEQECWLFIGALSGKTISIVCRTLFETGCRIGELHAIERTDVNEEACLIAIQHPEKNSNPRALKVSTELMSLLKTLSPKYGNNLFAPKKGSYEGAFYRQRVRAADRLGKPQFLKIHFHTFRHARASIDIANGIPLFEVKQNLGHKSILNTEKYVH